MRVPHGMVQQWSFIVPPKSFAAAPAGHPSKPQSAFRQWEWQDSSGLDASPSSVLPIPKKFNQGPDQRTEKLTTQPNCNSFRNRSEIHRTRSDQHDVEALPLSHQAIDAPSTAHKGSRVATEKLHDDPEDPLPTAKGIDQEKQQHCTKMLTLCGQTSTSVSVTAPPLSWVQGGCKNEGGTRREAKSTCVPTSTRQR